MNPRLTALATLGREAALPALVLVSIGITGFAGFDTSAAPAIERAAPRLAADVKVYADKIPEAVVADVAATTTAKAPEKIEVASASIDLPPPSDLSLASSSTREVAPPDTPPPAAQSTPDPIVTAALTDPSEKLEPETQKPDAESDQASPLLVPRRDIGNVDVLDECYVVDTCVDRYLFALYQRAPKEDTVKIDEQRQVTVKRKGKTVTVTRTFSRRADQDFGWKDPKAAEKAGMSMQDYVIGGMDRDFKLKLFHMLHAAEDAGQLPGITSGFRDDYRQSIASGLKAASNRSYHGGSLRGGYGHGLAADIVSVNGSTRSQRLASTQSFWKWVDAHGNEYGIGRPYLDRDPPHVGPTDGKEYADKRPTANAAGSKQAHRAAKRGRIART